MRGAECVNRAVQLVGVLSLAFKIVWITPSEEFIVSLSTVGASLRTSCVEEQGCRNKRNCRFSLKNSCDSLGISAIFLRKILLILFSRHLGDSQFAQVSHPQDRVLLLEFPTCLS